MTTNMTEIDFDILSAEEITSVPYSMFNSVKINKFFILTTLSLEPLSIYLLRQFKILNGNLISDITSAPSWLLALLFATPLLYGYEKNRESKYNEAIEKLEFLSNRLRFNGHQLEEIIDAYSIYYTKQRLYVNHVFYQTLYENNKRELISIRQTIDKKFIGSKLIKTELLTGEEAKTDIINTESTYYNPNKLIRVRCLEEKS